MVNKNVSVISIGFGGGDTVLGKKQALGAGGGAYYCSFMEAL